MNPGIERGNWRGAKETILSESEVERMITEEQLARQIIELQRENAELKKEIAGIQSAGANAEKEAIKARLASMSHAEIEKNWSEVEQLLQKLGQ